MIIAALLSLLGVEIWIILIVVGLLFWRSRWVKRRPGSFKCAIRRASGVVEGVPETFKLGYGMWVSNVFIWEKGRVSFRDILLPVDGIEGEPVRRAQPKEVKGLGAEPVIATLVVGSDARIEIAASVEDRQSVAGPFEERWGRTQPRDA